MIKILCLFQRDFSGGKPLLLRAVTQGSDWVLAGEGIATRKRDGTSCLVQGGVLYKRYDVKKGKSVPMGGIACTPQADAATGHWPHWVEVGAEPESVWHLKAWNDLKPRVLEDGTYELCGPKINGNPEGLSEHVFIRHGSEILEKVPRDFEGLREFLRLTNYEGIVFHHADGRMVKIRRDDYGFSWPPKPSSPPPPSHEDDATDEERRDWAAEHKHDFIKEGR